MSRRVAAVARDVKRAIFRFLEFCNCLVNKEVSSKRIYRQYSFLMLELMIALVLVGTFALPLAQFPMQAIQQEFKSAYRMQAQRLADLSYASIKEKLYAQEIPWKEIVKSRENRAVLPDEVVKVSLPSVGVKEFVIEKTLYSVGKKTKEGDEYRLVTYCAKVGVKDKKFKLFRTKEKQAKARIYTYQTLLCKSAAPAAEATQENIPPTETSRLKPIGAG